MLDFVSQQKRQQAAASPPRDDVVPTLGQVAGKNMRQIRRLQGLTQDEVSAALKKTGLFWQRSHVAALEAGNRELLDLGTLVLMSVALKVPVYEWLAGEGEVRLSADAVVRLRLLREWFDSGELPSYMIRREGRAQRASRASMDESLEASADRELSQRLGIPFGYVFEAAKRLWGHSLQHERDRRLAEFGEMAPAQRRARRGHITRQLTKELDPHLPKQPPLPVWGDGK